MEAHEVLDRTMVDLLIHWGQIPPPLLNYRDWSQMKAFESHAKEVGHDPWMFWAVIHDQPEVESLIRGLVRVDTDGLWPNTAFSQVVGVFAVYRQRWRFSERRMAEWITAHSTNKYLPYGSDRALESTLKGAPGMEFKFIKQVSAEAKASELILAFNAKAGVPVILDRGIPRRWPPIHPEARRTEMIRWALLPLEERINHLLEDKERGIDHFLPEVFMSGSEMRQRELPASLSQILERIAKEGGQGWKDWLQYFEEERSRILGMQK